MRHEQDIDIWLRLNLIEHIFKNNILDISLCC